jgi:hypothetical protein
VGSAGKLTFAVKVLAAAVFAGPPTGREGFIRALIEG